VHLADQLARRIAHDQNSPPDLEIQHPGAAPVHHAQATHVAARAAREDHREQQPEHLARRRVAVGEHAPRAHARQSTSGEITSVPLKPGGLAEAG
jgi:hypothetical protein